MEPVGYDGGVTKVKRCDRISWASEWRRDNPMRRDWNMLTVCADGVEKGREGNRKKEGKREKRREGKKRERQKLISM